MGTSTSGNHSDRRGHRNQTVIRISQESSRMAQELHTMRYPDKQLDIGAIADLAIHAYCAETPTAQRKLIHYSNGRDPYRGMDFCKRGHPQNGENLYINPRTQKRSCRACRRQHQSQG